eukprot:SAG22_NODE_2922_length_2101_cov_1.501499_1_plen_43_part_00
MLTLTGHIPVPGWPGEADTPNLADGVGRLVFQVIRWSLAAAD